jgi:hypothetical protein
LWSIEELKKDFKQLKKKDYLFPMACGHEAGLLQSAPSIIVILLISVMKNNTIKMNELGVV